MLFLFLFATVAFGAEVPQGVLRRTILDAARSPLESKLKQPVSFVLSTFLTEGDWAFYQGRLISPSGGSIDYSKSRAMREAIAEGLFEDNVQGLLKRTPTGEWASLASEVSCTDVCWEPWAQYFGAPGVLFPGNPDFIKLSAAPATRPRVVRATPIREPRGQERKDIVKAARRPITKDLDGKKVLFKFSYFRTNGKFAFYRGQLLDVRGQPINWQSVPRFADDVREGFFDDNVQGLLKKQDGQWSSLTHAIGCTDVCWEPWPQHFNCPKQLFGL